MIEAVVSLTSLGFLAAFGLSMASRKFHVDVDPRLEVLEDILPGLNCGACGYPGCPGFAEGLLAREAELTACAPGGDDVVAKLAEVLGLEAESTIKKIAFLKCGGSVEKAVMEAQYEGVEDCRAAILLGGGGKLCRYSCVGFGTCEKVCPFDAIVVAENGLPVVDPEKCTACNKCVVACPRDVLALEPAAHEVVIRCSSPEAAKVVKKACQVGCTGCGICEKVCPTEAATLDGLLASIDPDKCVQCGICASKCPTGAITDGMMPRPAVFISDACNGCTICAKICPTDAITGSAKELHEVDPARCIGCTLCIGRCPVDAIGAVD
jgi:Na+-translocating ferredoxin:NAD+ oxidoreductase RNF subunit RnfB